MRCESDKINEQISSYRETEEIIGLRCEKLPRLASFIDFLRDDEKNNTEEERKRFLSSEIGLQQQLLRNK